jgi:hypothetical protein
MVNGLRQRLDRGQDFAKAKSSDNLIKWVPRPLTGFRQQDFCARSSMSNLIPFRNFGVAGFQPPDIALVAFALAKSRRAQTGCPCLHLFHWLHCQDGGSRDHHVVIL